MIQYFKHRAHSKYLQKQWEDLVLLLTDVPVTKINRGTTVQFVNLFSQTMMLYINGGRLNKTTLRIVNIIKRLLADKRMFDAIKCLDYLLAGHNVSQYKMRKDVQERATAHLWSMANLYLQIVVDQRQSNPFAPGEALRQLEKSNDPEHNN